MSTVSAAARAAAFASLTLAASAVLADPLEETVVTATRTPVAAGELAAPLFVIDRDEIERSLAPDAGELLRTHAGLELARTGGPGQPTSLPGKERGQQPPWKIPHGRHPQAS